MFVFKCVVFNFRLQHQMIPCASLTMALIQSESGSNYGDFEPWLNAGKEAFNTVCVRGSIYFNGEKWQWMGEVETDEWDGWMVFLMARLAETCVLHFLSVSRGLYCEAKQRWDAFPLDCECISLTAESRTVRIHLPVCTWELYSPTNRNIDKLLLTISVSTNYK